MAFKKIIFQNRYVALETPSRSPPFMANTILNFHFDYWNTSLGDVQSDSELDSIRNSCDVLNTNIEINHIYVLTKRGCCNQISKEFYINHDDNVKTFVFLLPLFRHIYKNNWFARSRRFSLKVLSSTETKILISDEPKSCDITRVIPGFTN